MSARRDADGPDRVKGREEMSRSTDTTLAFFMGAIVGGVVALLLAPEKGEVTRRRISEGAVDLYDRSRDWVDHVGNDVRDRTENVADRARDKVSEVKRSARSQVDAVRGAVTEGRETYRREIDKT